MIRNCSEPRKQLKRIIFVFNVLWSVVFISAYFWGIYGEQASVMQLAEKEAMASFNKDLVYRRWASEHGGVYVPTTAETPPNPYLNHISERDITASSGKNLTLVNPAYMTRQVYELAEKQYGVLGHITSLNPVRPENVPDEWEKEALARFSSDTIEFSAIASINGKPYLRYMKRLVTEEGCLKCHAHQGYKIGDIRGGISTSVPLAEYYTIAANFQKSFFLSLTLVWAAGILLFNWGGRLLAIQLVSREKTEADLQVSEERFAFAEKGSSNGLWDWQNVHEDRFWWSEQYYSLLEFKPGEIEASFTSFKSLLHPDDLPRVEQATKDHFAEKKPFDLHYRLKSKSGEYKWFRAKGQATWDEGGHPVRMSGSIEDISLLKEHEARYLAMTNCTLDGFWVVATDGKLLDVNDSFCSMIGYSKNELLNMSVSEIEAIETQEETKRHIELVMKTGHHRFESVHRNKTGGLINVEASATYSPDGGGLIFAFIRDITAQKHEEEAKARLNAQLQQSQKMEAIGTLAGGIAHDFNNILSAILGYTELASLNAPSDSKFVKNLEKVLFAVNRARDLVKQILAFSRQTKIERIPIKLQSLVKETLKMLRASIPTTIEIIDKISSECGVVLADSTQVHQILVNLCTNASQAMETSGGVLTIQLSKVFIEANHAQASLNLAPGEYVELIVADTGPGIAPEIIDKIFDPYFTTKKPGKGTGMGLATIHGIIHSYGGAITVESKPGQGAIFHVFFPVVQEQEEVSSEDSESLEKPLPGSGKILFVDDEEILGLLGKEILEKLGYDVTVISNSLDALETFRKNPDDFKVVITDQTMPGMTGAELARKILQIRPEMPIILCTGFSNLVDEETAKSIGVKEFAMKPLNRAKIARLLQKALGSP